MPAHTQGSLLGERYRVVAHLGSGGMASVLLCEDERLGRQVAVKRLHADSALDVQQRFLREAKLGASLNHPNLVSVFDTATDEDAVLIVMEYVEGEALARTLRRGPLPAARVARMARELGSALDYAHAQDVVHRDVKPGNVLLRSDGVTKLVDLGIARAADQTRITRSGIVLGTAAYMAPEQLEGGEVGAPADIYALAAVCFEALSGERPRSGRTPMEIAHQVATGPPPDVREYAPRTPERAAEALRRGMARDPAERQLTAGALAQELAEALERPEPETAPTRQAAPAGAAAAAAGSAPPTRAASAPPARAASAPPARAASTLPRPSPRRGSRAALAVALGLLAVAVAAVAVVLLSGDDPPERAERPPQAQDERPQRERPDRRDEATPTEESAQPAPAPEQTDQTEPEADQPEAAEPEPPAGSQSNPARAMQLNEQGFALMQRGDFAGAVPFLEQAVAAWPENSRSINYAYALFNLGKSLNRSGRPEEAIPYLEKRLTWDDQRAVVEAELELAREAAG